jgi:hypothetical protein
MYGIILCPKTQGICGQNAAIGAQIPTHRCSAGLDGSGSAKHGQWSIGSGKGPGITMHVSVVHGYLCRELSERQFRLHFADAAALAAARDEAGAATDEATDVAALAASAYPPNRYTHTAVFVPDADDPDFGLFHVRFPPLDWQKPGNKKGVQATSGLHAPLSKAA